MRKYGRILNEKGEIEKIINLAFKTHSNFNEDLNKKEEIHNSIVKEMDEYCYNKFRYKELNSSKLIFLNKKKNNEQICSSIISSLTPTMQDTKSTKKEFTSEAQEICNSSVMSPQLRDNVQHSRKKTKLITNLKHTSALSDSLNYSEKKNVERFSALSSIKRIFFWVKLAIKFILNIYFK